MYIIILMIITVPLAGELKFYPFNETFRIGLGAPVMFFFLLLLQKVSFILPGFLTGAAVVLFRVTVDLMTGNTENAVLSFQHHIPAFFFYLTYACLFQLVNIKRFRHWSLIIGLIGLLTELIANGIELLIEYFLLQSTISFDEVIEMVIIAFIRCFVVVSFFNMVKLYEAQSREKQIREQNEHMMMLISNLYEEAVYLKKTLKNAETVTKESYDLYRALKEDEHAMSQRALRIAGEIHEIKKDNQRIFAGLSKLIAKESHKDYMSAEELIELIIDMNEKYSLLLGKQIVFTHTIKGNHSNYHVYTILSLVNNVVANAVEAIVESGTVHVELLEGGQMMKFHVYNSGSAVPEKYDQVIFEPGFTTKYDEHGNPSTGIGLAYVKEAVSNFGGDVFFKNQKDGVVFSILLPTHQLIQKG
ncbi:ATP-binding protein [Domibacillus antri]|uniref:histidine kinase n=1 Tax=Domibacillus antri TaxID=1714264 RepID=A0A1Q8Q4L0_9BACI|nr:sensor histidine kinase [Domibacillus antri]OLN22290.1 ATP-binding protein [Domibacillus antri]